jgi:hypothetical protein
MNLHIPDGSETWNSWLCPAPPPGAHLFCAPRPLRPFAHAHPGRRQPDCDCQGSCRLPSGGSPKRAGQFQTPVASRAGLQHHGGKRVGRTDVLEDVREVMRSGTSYSARRPYSLRSAIAWSGTGLFDSALDLDQSSWPRAPGLTLLLTRDLLVFLKEIPSQLLSRISSRC